MGTEEKIDRILWLLEDKEVGICPRMRNMERTVYGNGRPGLAECVRINNRNWAIVVSIISIAVPIIYRAFF